MTLGQKIQELRKIAQDTQADAAGKLGISIKQLGRYEHDVLIPNPGMLKKISTLYQHDLSGLMLGNYIQTSHHGQQQQHSDPAIEKLLHFNAELLHIIQDRLPADLKNTIADLVDSFAALRIDHIRLAAEVRKQSTEDAENAFRIIVKRVKKSRQIHQNKGKVS